MVIAVKNSQVCRNIKQFKTILQENKRRPNQQLGDRVYVLLLDLETGAMRFSMQNKQIESPLSSTSYEAWESVHLKVQQPLHVSDMHKKSAWTVVSETVNTLNYLASKVTQAARAGLLLEEVLLDQEIRLFPIQGEAQELVQWQGKMNRLEAEQFLSTQPARSFCLRELDPGMKQVVERIGYGSQVDDLQACVMTLLQADRTIHEFILIGTQKGWTFYQDRVDLSSPLYTYFSSLSLLINQIIERHLSSDV
jgi:hypothetical protein